MSNSLQVRGQSLAWERGREFVGSVIEPGAHSGGVGHCKNKAQAFFTKWKFLLCSRGPSWSLRMDAYKASVSSIVTLLSGCWISVEAARRCFLIVERTLADPDGWLLGEDKISPSSSIQTLCFCPALGSIDRLGTSRGSPMTTLYTECSHAGIRLMANGSKLNGATRPSTTI